MATTIVKAVGSPHGAATPSINSSWISQFEKSLGKKRLWSAMQSSSATIQRSRAKSAKKYGFQRTCMFSTVLTALRSSRIRLPAITSWESWTPASTWLGTHLHEMAESIYTRIWKAVMEVVSFSMAAPSSASMERSSTKCHSSRLLKLR